MAVRARDRLLDTAEHLFYAEGIRAVGIERILDESGVGRASLYRHFTSKNDLVVAVLKRRDQQWRTWLQAAVTATPNSGPLAVFDALADRFAADDYRGCAFINTMVETADFDSPAHAVARHHKHAVIEYLSGLLHNSGYPESLAPHLMLLMDGAIVTAVRERDPGVALLARDAAAALLASATGNAGPATRADDHFQDRHHSG